MKIKRCTLLICMFCCSLLFTGCGEPLYTMTAEEESIITLYASKTVSKFNKNQTTGICNARVKVGELDENYEADEEDIPEEEVVEDENLEVNPEDGEITEEVDVETVLFNC